MFKRYTIRSLLAAMVAVSLLCLVFNWRHNRLVNHQQAMRSLQSLGAELVMFTSKSGPQIVTDPSLIEQPFVNWISGVPTVQTTVVSLVDPNINSDDVSEMVPHLAALLPSPYQESDGKPFIYLIVSNQTCMTQELRNRIDAELPHFVLTDFSDPKYRPSRQVDGGITK